MGHGRTRKGQYNRARPRVATVYLKAWMCLPPSRFPKRQDMEYQLCSVGSEGMWSWEKKPRNQVAWVPALALQPLTVGKSPWSLISKVETWIILVPAS